MIDPEKVRRFWQGRAAVAGKVAFESVANLEQDQSNLQLKIDDETAKVFDWLPAVAGMSVLDLGAGVGQWSFRFAERGATRVLAVEYAQGLVEIAEVEARRRGMEQVEFQVCSAEGFDTRECFDLVFISGLFVYLNDDQARSLLDRLAGFVRPGGLLMVRDGTGVGVRHEINDRFSEHLGEFYSATYRTRDDYLREIEGRGIELLRDENMFEEGHPLNKYPETRLHLFMFRRPA
ncbi:class I SAM-dependent methyltransferase [Stutzerimonas nitrititolerans]|uniref:class I SAM-dependent methyltransferase n=1 Tax=Stutzerimonas nitrititolerans TaxID=2482751 RepID=UPI0028B1C4B3|nr:class I SAM-dependent methyltransferase [Stutzerimonas nitrititolerans]